MVWALPIWTLLIWATRIRNILGDDGHSRTELVVPVVLTVLAVAALLDRNRGLRALAAVTVGVWAIRLPLVLVHDHGAAFKVVHAVLAVVSIALAVAAWRSAATRRPALSSSR
jgi:NADH:ubiquinone oxidoreductase subunit K